MNASPAPRAKLLIANRGEIACRIIRTARQMGFATVAIYSDPDKSALHVESAHEAVRVGPAAATQSYLDIEAIIAAAKRTEAGFIHPGYGFLSESPEFARACETNALKFVGPSADAIASMGNKAEAKRIAREAGVPLVPGYDGDDQDDATLAREANRIGYPLLIKAVAGGGGRGMRIVHSSTAFVDALQLARSEARSSFGNDRVMLERLIENARHIEVQVFGDCHGNIVHLFERDCSTQRRHQKIIEEAPAPQLGEKIRAALWQHATALAGAISYEGAGTVEFIVDARDNAYFLEMNTRLQVEHPVTEMITGQDLVAWQLVVAGGGRLPLAQSEITSTGHAIEARLYAEDPSDGFSPRAGRISHWLSDIPNSAGGSCAGAGIRIDAGVRAGDEITPYYDPMFAKVIAHGRNRTEAANSLIASLERQAVFGLVTNRSFLIGLLQSEDFRESHIATRTIDNWIEENKTLLQSPATGDEDFALTALYLAARAGGDWFRNSGPAVWRVRLTTVDAASADDFRDVEVRVAKAGTMQAQVGEVTLEVSDTTLRGSQFSFLSGGLRQSITAVEHDNRIFIDHGGHSRTFERWLPGRRADHSGDATRIVAPVTGMLREVRVSAGEEVAAGATVAIIEAMKMQTHVRAATAGRIVVLSCAAGDQVAAGATIATLELTTTTDQGV